jgi:predicted flavoprotein YhiN
MSPPPKTRSQSESTFDVIIVGGGASGMIAAISAARRGRRVLICEQSKSMGIKLLASGGERCNLSNTLGQEQFMERVRPHGRFMGPALELLGGPKLRQFFEDIGQPTVVLAGESQVQERPGGDLGGA